MPETNHGSTAGLRKAGKPYFVLKAANGEVIGTSEEYSSVGAMENGIAAVRQAAPMAPTDDRT